MTAPAGDAGWRLLAVASTGGHLAELHRLVPRMLPAGGAADWVTFDTPQSRSLLAGEHVDFVRPVRPREAGSVIANLPSAAAILRRRPYQGVVGCGAAALAFLPVARSLGMDAHWIEAATRTDGPSLSGRLLGTVPRVRRYTQHPRWAGRSWLYRGSVFDEFERERAPREERLQRVVVTLGMNPYPFRRLLRRVLEIVPPSVEVLWQTGKTPPAGLPIDARAAMPADELDRAIAEADVVIAHAGTGSALAALQGGHVPVLVPRREAFGEQVDDHQLELAADLAARGLALAVPVEELSQDVLWRASALRSRRRDRTEPFELA